MSKLSDDLLIETYHRALNLNLSPDFVHLLKKEICRRSLEYKISNCA